MCDNTATWHMFSNGPGINMLSFFGCPFIPYTYACDEHKDAMNKDRHPQAIKPEHIRPDITCCFRGG